MVDPNSPIDRDAIHLTGIRGYGYTGYLPEEQILGQWFEVNLTLWLDLRAGGNSDRLEDTLDYRGAIEIVQRLIETSRFALVEKLATAIAIEILAIGSVQQVRVQLTKPNPPIPHYGGKITIDITRNCETVPSPPVEPA